MVHEPGKRSSSYDVMSVLGKLQPGAICQLKKAPKFSTKNFNYYMLGPSMAYCPSCFTILKPSDMACAKCHADFGTDSAWKPLDNLPFDVKQHPFFSFTGRMSRSRFFAWFLIAQIAPLVATYVALFVDAENVLAIAVFVYIALSVIFTFPVVKRLHDLDMSGWYVLALFIPLIGTLLGIVLLISKGTAGPNKYGLGASEETTAMSRVEVQNEIAGPRADSMESRLERLAELRAKGLISEEVFSEKQKQIIDAL